MQDVLVNNSSVVDESTGVANVDLSGYFPRKGGLLTGNITISPSGSSTRQIVLSNYALDLFAPRGDTGSYNNTRYLIDKISYFDYEIKYPSKTGTIALVEDIPTLKTIFGNQSLTGSGNIDLYRHNILILCGIGQYAIGLTVIDSNINNEVDSLTDLITLLYDKGRCSASGMTANGVVYGVYVRDNLCYVSTVSTTGGTYSKVLGTDVAVFQITDTVTTI